MTEVLAARSSASRLVDTGGQRYRNWLPAAAGVVVATLAGGAVALHVVNGSAGSRVAGEYWLSGLLGSLAFGLPGAVLARRRPGNAVGWVSLAIGASRAVAFFGKQYGIYCLLKSPRTLPGGAFGVWVASWCWVPAEALVPTLLVLVFPGGGLLSRRWRPVVWATVVGTVMGAAGFAFLPYAQMDRPTGFPGLLNPVGVVAVGPLAPIGLAVLALCALLAVTSLVLRFRRSGGIERQQVKCVLFAAVVVLVLLGIGQAVPGVSPLVDALAVVPLPVAVSLAVLRFGLWGIDVVIHRAIVYGTLTAAVLVTYVVTVQALGDLLGRSTGAPLFATGLVAVGVHPLWRRLQRAASRLLYGDREDPATAIVHLGERLEAAAGPDQVLPGVVEAVARALRLPYAAVVVSGGPGACYGTPGEDALHLPLTYQSDIVGQLIAGWREPGVGFSRADRRLLEGLARQVAIAAHGVLLNADLQRSRQRAVTAREEERRRLRRDLHDELGPSLAGLAHQLEFARDLLGTDVAAADRLLERLRRQAGDAVGDVRRLVYDLRPPALDELGLVGTLREHAERFNNSSLQVITDAPGSLGPLPAAVEVAAYRIVCEALANVVRHARARRCTLSLSRSANLEVSVVDDGTGFELGRAGVGLSSMRERAEELGGECVITTSPGRGTTVQVWLPLPESR